MAPSRLSRKKQGHEIPLRLYCLRDDDAPRGDGASWPVSHRSYTLTYSIFLNSEDTYNVLREGLLDRICDKESLIRAHAVVAIAKLIGSEDLDEVETGERTILEILLDIVLYDPMP